MIKLIVKELKEHSPFTLFGALTGILLMMVFRNIPARPAEIIFYVFHPLHVIFSAVVTTALYRRFVSPESIRGWRFWKVLAVGYIGSVGIGTLSDCLIPFWGESLLELPHAHMHIGFIEMWWLINPLAVAGILVGYFRQTSHLPHAAHVLLSTWASLFHMLMAGHVAGALPYFGIFVFLFIAVWVPCCLSDIVFPLLFVKGRKDIANLSHSH